MGGENDDFSHKEDEIKGRKTQTRGATENFRQTLTPHRGTETAKPKE